MNKKKTIIISVLSAVAVVFLALLICASTMLPFWQDTIDKYFLGQGLDLSNYDPEPDKAYSVVIEEEGIVLLKNENGMLPLEASRSAPAKVSVFGIRAGNMKFTGSGSGGGDVTQAIQLDDALAQSNIKVCQRLFDYYQSFDSTKNEGGFDVIGKDPNSAEISIKNVTKSLLDEAKSFSDTAIYVIGRVGAEEGTLDEYDLCLSVNEEETLDYIVENYAHVIVIMNTSNTYELGFIDGKGVGRNTGNSLDKYAGKIDAALWVGCPGLVGSIAIGEVLAGTVNPSGRLADTYPYDNLSSPAANNYKGILFSDNATMSYASFVEGIYVGYKWYETAAFEGAIDYDDHSGEKTLPYMNRNNGQGVMYPFGYGLSYTDFTWDLVKAEEKDGEITLTVTVTNTGNVAGKDVVEVYYTPPYTSGGIEKAHVNLVDFAKTDLIAPNGGTDTVTIKFAVEDMKTYDYNDANGNGNIGYELESGDYYIRLLKNAHDWVNVGTDSALCYTYHVDETVKYTKDTKTGVDIESRFADMAGGIEYISRANGFANANIAKTEGAKSTTDFTDAKGNTNYVVNTQKPYGVPAESNSYVKGVDYEVVLDKTITLDRLTGLDYDDPLWDKFISQMSKSEMCTIIAKANFATAAVERLGIPYCLLSDGPSGIKSTYTFNNSYSAVCFPSAIVLASTWNKDVARGYGEHIAEDGRQTGVSTWYAPSINLRRTPFDGRCFEYYSECGVLTGRMAADVVYGAQSNGLNCAIKHLILYGNNATFQWCNEQQLRDYFLLPFEWCVKDGGATSMMTTTHLFGVFCGASEELLTDLIRGEWGFEGFITTDASSTAMNITRCIRAGNDLWLASDSSFYKTIIKDSNVGVIQRAVKHYLYAIANSSIAMNADIEAPTWSPSMLIMGLLDAVSVIAMGLCAFFVVRIVLKDGKARPESVPTASDSAVSDDPSEISKTDR